MSVGDILSAALGRGRSNTDHPVHATRMKHADAARRAAHDTHKRAHQEAEARKAAADAARDAEIAAIEKSLKDAHAHAHAVLVEDVYAVLTPVCAEYLADARGATAEAVRVAWKGLADRAVTELGSPLLFEVLLYAMFPGLTLGDTVDVRDALRKSVDAPTTFATALRCAVERSENANVRRVPPSEHDRNTITTDDIRRMELVRVAEQRERSVAEARAVREGEEARRARERDEALTFAKRTALSSTAREKEAARTEVLGQRVRSLDDIKLPPGVI